MSGERAGLTLRPATGCDTTALERLIADSARRLGAGIYTDAENAAAIAHVFGVDGRLIDDGTYLVAELDGRLAGCGGWSRRRTLFGGDRYAERDDAPLDPARDPARIRAFFVAPEAARRGVASALLARCEAAAHEAGFARLALMATLPGIPFYARHGFVAGAMVTLPVAGTSVRFVPMEKLLQRSNSVGSSLTDPQTNNTGACGAAIIM